MFMLVLVFMLVLMFVLMFVLVFVLVLVLCNGKESNKTIEGSGVISTYMYQLLLRPFVRVKMKKMNT